MIHEIRALWDNAFLKAGLRLSTATPLSDVAAFIDRARPIAIDAPLIRLGPEGDGGYLVPDDLDGIAACFSPGVGDNSAFELDLAERGVPVFLADGTVDGPATAHPLFHFTRRNIGVEDTASEMRLDTWVREQAPESGDLMLQMDIEGAEYLAILDTPAETLRRFRILTIEFHSLNRLFDPAWFVFCDAVFSRLARDFHVVHAHPNNVAPPVGKGRVQVPPLVEFTFLRRDRAAPLDAPTSFPHPLDSPCVSYARDHVLPKCWWR